MGKDGLVVALPTRHRLSNVERFIRSFHETRELPGTRLVIARDDDDPTYDSLACGPGVEIVTLPRASMVTQLNIVALAQAPLCRAVLCLGDDNRFCTAGWDRRFTEEVIRYGSGLYCGSDLASPPGDTAHVLMTADVIEALGWMGEPSMRHYFVDNVWMELGPRHYVPDVIMEHLHYSSGKAPYDATYQETLSNFFAHDAAAFERWRNERRGADVQTVLKVLAHGEIPASIESGMAKKTYSPDGQHYPMADRPGLWCPRDGSYCTEADPCPCDGGSVVTEAEADPGKLTDGELSAAQNPSVTHVSDGDSGTSGESAG